MYYIKGWTQEEIAARLGISKMSVSRRLQDARNAGVVEFVVRGPVETNRDLQTALTRSYPLTEALVLKNSMDEGLFGLLGRGGAFYLDVVLKDGSTIGIGAGRTLARVIQHVPQTPRKDVKVVQLMGGGWKIDDQNPFNLVQNLCRALQATGEYFYAPVIAGSDEARDTLMADLRNRLGRRDIWLPADIALIGVGGVDEETTFIRDGFLTQDEINELKSKGAVGDVLGYYFDAAGNVVDVSLHRRLIAASPEDLNQIPLVVAVAGGLRKLEAIRGALLTNCIDVLITEEATAAALVATHR